MQAIYCKTIICLISLKILLLADIDAYAEKTSIDKHNRYIDSEMWFIDEQENKVYLDQFEGTNILLVFWATWCGNCVSELPALDNFQKDFRKLPFKIIAVSQDYNGLEMVKKHFAAQNIRHLEIFHDPKNQLFRELSVNSLPTAFFINADGKNKLVLKGTVKWYDDEIRRMILSEIDVNLDLPKNTYKIVELNRSIMQNGQGANAKVELEKSEPTNSSQNNENEGKNDS